MAGSGRKELMSRTLAVAAALLVLVAAAEAGTCNVDGAEVLSQCASFCTGLWCCAALRYADFGCLCRTYGDTIKSTPYAGCAMAIPTKCNIRGASRSC